MNGFRLAAVSILLGLVVWATLGPPKPAATHIKTTRVQGAFDPPGGAPQ